MISPQLVKIIAKLPRPIVTFCSDKILNYYVDKYSNLKIENIENLKGLKKPVLFIGNHLSNSDALVINKALKSQELTFVAGVKLGGSALAKLGLSIVKTINIRPNTADKEALSKIVTTLKSNNNVFIFPEGTRSRTGAMIEGRKGIVLIQRLSKATIVPIGLWGSEKLLPIDDTDMGLEKFHQADVHLKIGEPIKPLAKNEGEDKHQYEDRLMEHYMKSIARLLPEEYRGVYK